MGNKGLYELFQRLAAQETDDCIVWEYNKVGGYGYICVNSVGIRVHRLAYEMRVGPIPKGKLLMHSCDNRPCFNYRHLHPGTPKENTQDAQTKGRIGKRTPSTIKHNIPERPWLRGTANHRNVLSEAQVLEIRATYQRGVTGAGQYTLAKRFGVSTNLIRGIVARRKWKHV